MLCTIELLQTHPPDRLHQTSERQFTFLGPGGLSRQGTSLTTITTGKSDVDSLLSLTSQRYWAKSDVDSLLGLNSQRYWANSSTSQKYM